jgi:transcriptional regulator with XRE-family HTH domain
MLLSDPHNAARPPPYPFLMGAAKDSIQETLAINVKALMERRGWTQVVLGKRAGMSQTHVGNVLRKNAAPTSVIISKLARAFDLPDWLLLVPNLPVELLDSKEVPALLQAWLSTRLSR